MYGGAVHLSDMSLSNNTADLGGGLYLSDGNFALPSPAHVTCGGDSSLNSAIIGNTSNGLGSVVGGAIHVEENTFFHSDDCYLGGNTGKDLVQESGNWVIFNSSIQHTGLYEGSSTTDYENCASTSDLNGNGDAGYEDAFCMIEPGVDFLSTQERFAWTDPTCASTSTNNTMVSYGEVLFSGCFSTQVVQYGADNDFYVETYLDFQVTECETAQPSQPGSQHVYDQLLLDQVISTLKLCLHGSVFLKEMWLI